MKNTSKPGGGPRKPSRDGDRPARSGDRPFRKDGEKKSFGGDGERPARGGDRPFRKDGEKKSFGGDGERPARGGDRPFRKDGEKKSFGGDKKSAGGERKSFGARSKPAPKKNPAHVEVAGEGERISKIMARAGVASRRDCERMILEGRVSLNGTVLTTPAVNCTAADSIEVDGQPIGAIERTRLWIYYKPGGLVTTNYDPEGRPTVFDNLPVDLPRVISVGRLDINTEGLLLLTNDGGLARMLELPTTGWLRRYRVRAHGSIDQDRLDELKEGIAVDGVFYGAIEATLDREQGHNVWITMGLREGKNREIKNVLGALGLDVNRLIRISYGPFQLGELEEGQVVEVKSRTLRDQLGPRLIADANANFEAPIHNVAKPADEDEDESGAPQRQERPRRESREERRDRDLARIDTKRPERGERGDRPRRDDRDRDGDRRGPPRGRDRDRDDDKPKRPPLGTVRTANVWMAPGARPVAEANAKKGKTAEPAKRRVIDLKTGEESFIEGPVTPAKRKHSPTKAAPNKGARGEKRSGERAFGDKPAGKKPFGDKSRDDKSRDDKPRGGKSFAAKASGEKFGDRPSRDEKPRGGKPFGAKSGGEKSGGDRPKGKPFAGDRTRGGEGGGDATMRRKPGKGKTDGADRRR